MANTTFAAPSYPGELNQLVWHTQSPSIPQSGTVITNKGGGAPANSYSGSTVTVVARANQPHQPVTINVKGS